jgi:hypothetical protein
VDRVCKREQAEIRKVEHVTSLALGKDGGREKRSGQIRMKSAAPRLKYKITIRLTDHDCQYR